MCLVVQLVPSVQLQGDGYHDWLGRPCLAPDRYSVRPTQRINTRVVAQHTAAALFMTGVTLYEPCGGLCAGLEAVLRNGIRIQRYIYSDISAPAQNVARVRVAQLHRQYPHLVASDAFDAAFTTLPMDILQCTSAALVSAGARAAGEQWLVIAGPECKDFSPAGKSRGLSGPYAPVLEACINIIGALQQLRQGRGKAPLYILENAAMQHNFRSQHVREVDFPAVCQRVGVPVVLDAARVGSYAHRLRNFWQNLAPHRELQRDLATMERMPGIHADDVLKPGRFSSGVAVSDHEPFYPANQRGEPRSAFPTLVAYPLSRAFRPDRAGAVYDTGAGGWSEPDPDERERILGYPVGCTIGSPPITPHDRHVLTGNCMDQAALSTLLRLCANLAVQSDRRGQLPRWDPVWSARPTSAVLSVQQPAGRVAVAPPQLLGSEVALLLAVHAGDGQPAPNTAVLDVDPPTPAPEGSTPGQLSKQNKRMARAAYEPGAKDILTDDHVLEYLTKGKLPPHITLGSSIRRIIRRARGYRVVDSPGGSRQVYRLMGNGAVRMVPPVGDRMGVIDSAHRMGGHFGVRRTTHLLLASYWWQGILADVAKVVKQCAICDRQGARFDQPTTELQPLPIRGLFFRWGVDTSGPYAVTRRGNRYIMHAIEHFSALLVVEPMPSKEARDTAYAFQHGVLERFGACAEVLTDNGGEYMGEFQQMLTANFIDHPHTSPNHPQANGLAERSVGTVKRALRAHCEDTLNITTWDEKLPFVSLAYNCSIQQSSRCSPYQLVYARTPVFPSSAAQEAMRQVLPDFEVTGVRAQQAAAASLLQRAAYLRQVLPIIASNLSIMQHRDAKRYALVRSGGWYPQLRKFTEGDYVYVRRPNQLSTLQIPAKQLILRVMQAKPSGAVMLQGRCGCIVRNHIRNLSRCHLPHIDGTLHPELARPEASLTCEKCGVPDDDVVLLLCDICSMGWHGYCLQPPLLGPPKGDWICPNCRAAGITVVPPECKGSAPRGSTRAALADRLFADKATRARDAAARVYDGRLVSKVVVTPAGVTITVWGVVHYLGDAHRPNYYAVRYDDGSEETLTRRGLTTRRPLQPGAQRPVSMVMPAAPPPPCHHPAHCGGCWSAEK